MAESKFLRRMKYAVAYHPLPSLLRKKILDSSGKFLHSATYDRMYRKHIAAVNKRITTPMGIQIEASNFCNASCVMCPHSLQTRKKGIMSMEMYQRIIDDIKTIPTVKTVTLSGFGEPLLDSMLFDKIRYARKARKDWKIQIFTNAALLTKEKADELITTGVDMVNISFNGANRDDYNNVMKGLNYDKTIANVNYFTQHKGKVFVVVSCVLTTLNTEHAKELPKLFPHADSVFVGPPDDWIEGLGEKSQFVVIKSGRKKYPCFMMNHPIINFDGTVGICCRDWNKLQVVGDIDGKKFLDVWNDPEYVKFRENHHAGKLEGICATCNVPYDTPNTTWWGV